jgi:glycosyltransferase involved in cell wall biosynthesis
MAGKRIGMVLNSFYPDDIRVRKEARALADRGNEVFLLCYRKKGEAKYEDRDGMKIFRVFIGQTRIAEGLWDMVNACFFYHPLIGHALKRFVAENNIEILHVHDLPLAGTVETTARRKNLKWVLDLHENYPEGLKIWYKWRKSTLIRMKNRVFFGYKRWLRFERRASERCDRIIAVVDEMKERIVQNYGISPGKIHVISNTESSDFTDQKIIENIYGDISGRFIVLYAGGLGPHRGVDTVIRAFSMISDRQDIFFVIVGSGNRDVVQSLRNLADKLGVSGKVVFKGYQPFQHFFSYMSQASVSVIPHTDNSHTNHTIPHKLFQSMMAGRPVLVSTCKPLKRTVEQAESGLVFEAGNPDDCAQKILSLYRNRDLALKLGKNGIEATINGTLNWETTGSRLADLYDDI